jgi:integrase/recombinase XerD
MTVADPEPNQHGHRVLLVHGKGDKIVLVPLPPVVARAAERAIAGRDAGPILRTTRGSRMDRHAATRRLHRSSNLGEVGERLGRLAHWEFEDFWA